MLSVYDAWRPCQFSTNQRPRNYLRHTHTQRIKVLAGPALRAAPAKISPKKEWQLAKYTFIAIAFVRSEITGKLLRNIQFWTNCKQFVVINKFLG